MNKQLFDWLPTSTYVESHNRLIKSGKPDILHEAMMSTYGIDMSNALEHIARQQESKATKNTAGARKRSHEDDGPPDKHRDFCKGILSLLLRKK